MIAQPCPTFSLPMTDGKTFDPINQKGRAFVLYFYPRDNTRGCTLEGDDFRDHYDEFQALDVDIFGISRDSLTSHEKFRQKEGFPFHLISDPEEIACHAFDVIKLKMLYGRQVRGIVRSTFLIDKNGIIAAQWRNVKVPGHVQAVLQAAKAL